MVRAPALHAGGPRFESWIAHQNPPIHSSTDTRPQTGVFSIDINDFPNHSLGANSIQPIETNLLKLHFVLENAKFRDSGKGSL